MAAQAKDIFSDTVKRIPVICEQEIIDGISCIVGIFQKESGTMGRTQHLAMLYEQDGIWHQELEYELDDIACYPEIASNFEMVNGGKYFFFERLIHHAGTMFQGTGCVEFSLFEIRTNSLNRFYYDGLERKGGIQGQLRLDKLESADKRFCRNYLNHKVLESTQIYRTPDSFSLDDPKNCLQQWEVRNADFFRNEYGTTNFNYHIENLLGADNVQTLDQGKEACEFAENERYIAFLSYQGAIIGYRKSDKKYFVILVPEGLGGGGGWGMRSFQHVRLNSENEMYTQSGYQKPVAIIKMIFFQKTVLLKTVNHQNDICGSQHF
jgi:hypothetical protein